MKLESNKFYVSGIYDHTKKLYDEYGFGVEHTVFAYAKMMDDEIENAKKIISNLSGDCKNYIFHAPFNELTMAPIDDKIGEMSMYRYNQFYNAAMEYHPKKLVYHSGFLKMVYYREWFEPQSINFLLKFLEDKKEDVEICLENVFSETPDFIYSILKAVNSQSKVPLKMCLDIGHVNAYAHETTVFEWIDKCKDYITHMHIHNNNGEKDYHNDVYDGSLDVKKIMDYALDINKDMTFTIECRKINEFPEFIRRYYL